MIDPHVVSTSLEFLDEALIYRSFGMSFSSTSLEFLDEALIYRSFGMNFSSIGGVGGIGAGTMFPISLSPISCIILPGIRGSRRSE